MQYQCLVFLLLLLLPVKLLSAEFAAVRELSAEKFNGTRIRVRVEVKVEVMIEVVVPIRVRI